MLIELIRTVKSTSIYLIIGESPWYKQCLINGALCNLFCKVIQLKVTISSFINILIYPIYNSTIVSDRTQKVVKAEVKFSN